MSKRIFIAVICAYYLGISEQCVIKEIIGTYFFAKKTQKEREGVRLDQKISEKYDFLFDTKFTK